MNWLVTGGCGFIGSALVRALAAEPGARVRVLDDLSSGSRSRLATAAAFRETPAASAGPLGEAAGAEPVELIVGDICDPATARIAARGADVVVHLAANTGVAQSVESPVADCVTNVLGTLYLLEAARAQGVARFVFASSGAPVGEVEPPIHEELAPHPVSPYGASKLAGEGYCSAYSRSFGLETVALRFGNVYGPGSDHKGSVVARFIRRALRGEPLEVYGDGRQTRDFVFVADLVRAIRAAAAAPGVGGEIFQIATQRETTVLELVEALVPALEAAGVRGIEIAHAAPRVGDVLRNYSDTTKAREGLGWRAETPLARGLALTVSWFLKNQAALG